MDICRSTGLPDNRGLWLVDHQWILARVPPRHRAGSALRRHRLRNRLGHMAGYWGICARSVVLGTVRERPLCDIQRVIMGGRKLPFMGNRFTSEGNVEHFLDLPNSWQRTGTLTAKRHRLKRRSRWPQRHWPETPRLPAFAHCPRLARGTASHG